MKNLKFLESIDCIFERNFTNICRIFHKLNVLKKLSLHFLFFSFFLVLGTAANAQLFLENNGLVVMEVESAKPSGNWGAATALQGYSGIGYFIATADYLGVGGEEILNFKFSIKTPGIYQVQVRSKIGEGTSTTDFNDSWIRLLGSDSKPMVPVANDNVVSNSWYKYYQNKKEWTWQTSNKDFDPHSISWNLTPGNYWFQISMRSKGHAIDKIVFWNKSKYAFANETTGDTNATTNADLDALPLSKIEADNKQLPKNVSITPINPLKRKFNKKKDILIAQFDNKPDADDIHAQAALGSILSHRDGAKINYFAVMGAYGSQKGKYIDSSSLFTLAFGPQNTNWTDAHTDRDSSVTRIVAKVKPILQAGGLVWVQEAGQSDITADWIAQLLADGIPPQTIKTNVIVVQHSVWNENATTKVKLTFVKNNAKYVDIDDGNVDFGDYLKNIQRLVQTPKYVSTDGSFMVNAMSTNNSTTNARALWTEADKIIKDSGFKASYSEITKGGVDFSDCVETWYIVGLGSKADSVAKFWSRYVFHGKK